MSTTLGRIDRLRNSSIRFVAVTDILLILSLKQDTVGTEDKDKLIDETSFVPEKKTD